MGAKKTKNRAEKIFVLNTRTIPDDPEKVSGRYELTFDKSLEQVEAACCGAMQAMNAMLEKSGSAYRVSALTKSERNLLVAADAPDTKGGEQ